MSQNPTDKFDEKLTALMNRIGDAAKQKELLPEVQQQLGKLIRIAYRMTYREKIDRKWWEVWKSTPKIEKNSWSYERRRNSHNLVLFEIVINALLGVTPNIELAQIVRRRLKERTLRYKWMRWLILRTTISVVVGLLFAMAIAFALFAFAGNKSFCDDNLLSIGIFGFIGGVLSILTRITTFNDNDNDDTSLDLFFTGLCKPIVGAGFALFVYATLKSGIINIGPQNTATLNPDKPFFYLALAFVSGFSERLAADTSGRIEKMFGSSKEDKKALQTVSAEIAAMERDAIKANTGETL